MSGLAGHARSGQGGSNISKAAKARGTITKAEASSTEEDGSSEDGSSDMSTAAKTAKSLAAHARAGVAKDLPKPSPQPAQASNIPGAGPQGVPPAEADQMGAFARRGNADMIPTAVAAQTGEATLGPAMAGSVARMGGQVRLAPGQIRAWAHPTDLQPSATSEQVKPVAPAPAVY